MMLLFLEDNLDFASTLTDFAVQLGHAVDHTSDILEASMWFDSRHYDAVISDVHLKKNDVSLTSGLDFVSFIRKKRKSNVVIAVTTGLELLKEKDIKDHGVDIFYYKPISVGYHNFLSEIEDKVRERAGPTFVRSD